MDHVRVTMGTAYEDGVFTVGLAEEDGVGVLVFSRSDVTEEPDSLLGMDTYSLSTESGATFYGGVESAKLNETELHFTSPRRQQAYLACPPSYCCASPIARRRRPLGLDYAVSGSRRLVPSGRTMFARAFVKAP